MAPGRSEGRAHPRWQRLSLGENSQGGPEAPRAAPGADDEGEGPQVAESGLARTLLAKAGQPVEGADFRSTSKLPCRNPVGTSGILRIRSFSE